MDGENFPLLEAALDFLGVVPSRWVSFRSLDFRSSFALSVLGTNDLSASMSPWQTKPRAWKSPSVAILTAVKSICCKEKCVYHREYCGVKPVQ